ncbi:MAG: Smr/MutS family protein [Gemmatimonadetes bacterium]|nr:Smr/MutS family protein [Gemmatimonadota bacterium]
MRRKIGYVVARALDDARFGPARTLDLRAGLPSVAVAVRRAEPWLRERQMARAGEVLIVTGRGLGSPGGVGAIRQAIQSMLVRLRRVGVVARVIEHNPGAFVVELAPIRALFETVPRSRNRQPHHESPDPDGLLALDPETRSELRRLAEYSLSRLGAPITPKFVEDEMLRQFGILAGGIDPAESDRAARLKFVVTAARQAYEDD